MIEHLPSLSAAEVVEFAAVIGAVTLSSYVDVRRGWGIVHPDSMKKKGMATRLRTASMRLSFACSANPVRANMVPWCLAQGQCPRPCFQQFLRLSRLYYRLSR